MKKLGILSCLIAMLGASPASAAPAGGGSRGGLDGQLTVFGIIGYGYYWSNPYGIGLRYQKVLAPNVLQAQIHDDIAIEGGLDLLYSSWSYPDYYWNGLWYDTTATYTAISPVVGLVWNFWLNDKLSVYPKLDFGYQIGRVSIETSDPYWNTYYNNFYRAHSYPSAYLDLAGGIAVKLDALTLRAQAGIRGLYLGVGFQL